MAFTFRDDTQIILHDNTGIPAQDNLIITAAKALQQRLTNKFGIDIHLDKKLPMGGGLGGGSSNAATTLLALNRLWQLNLSLDELAAIGLTLGADVPVFVHGNSAWAEGVGEKLTALDLPNSWFIIVKPDVFVSTGEIFSSETLTRDTEMSKMASFLKGNTQCGNQCNIETFKNDCEQVVRARYPQIDNALNMLSSIAQKAKIERKARLTGTGACIFLQCASERDAQTIAEQLPADWNYFIAEGINQSPVHAKLK